jgi:hypothetical protein
MANLPQRLLVGVIFCLFPLLIYCFLLMGLNGRRRASIVPGTWDFAGVLLATSGFVLGGGPMILILLNSSWRQLVYRGKVSDWRLLTGEGDFRALMIWAIFFFVVVVGAAILIFMRRNVTVLYNTDTNHIWDALEWVFGRLGIVWKRQENTYELRKLRGNTHVPWEKELQSRDRADKNLVVQAQAPASTEAVIQPATARLTVRILPTNCNVTMIWDRAQSELRDQVESEMTPLLPNIRAEYNPVTGWLATAITVILALMVCAMILVIVLLINSRTAL